MIRPALTLSLALAATGCTGPVECVADYYDAANEKLGSASFEYEDIDVDTASSACSEDAAAEAPAGTVLTKCNCDE